MVKIYQKRKVNINQSLFNYSNIQKILAQNKRLKNKLRASNIIIKKVKHSLSILSTKEYKNNYQYCPKKIYLKYEKLQIKGKLKRSYRRNKINVNKLKIILKKLNASKSKQKIIPDKHVNAIISNKIGNQISESKFLKGVENSVDNINNTWPYNKIRLLKTELNQLDYSNFDFDTPLSNLKIDSFLDLLLTPGNDFKIPNNSIKMLNIKNCTKIPLLDGIKFINPKLNKEIIFNKDFIKAKVSNNIGILNSFYKMLQKFTNIQHINLDKLTKLIEKMIDSTKIYFCDMPINICGITISNGDIYISGDYLYEALGETKEYKILKDNNEKNYYKFTAICKIYLTLLHEYSHKLHYLVRKKESKNEEWKDNFFDHSEEINPDYQLEYFIDLNKRTRKFETKKNYTYLHQNKIQEESGEFFDVELYLGPSISEIDNDTCDFFLSDKCSSYNNYIQKIKKIRNNINNKSTTRASNSKFKIKGNPSRCYFGILRQS